MREGGDVWFSEGWNDFAEFHSLALGHFLVFEYEGNSRFHVLVSDKSYSEIEYPDIDTSSMDDEDHDEDEDKRRAEMLADQCVNPHFVVQMRPSYLRSKEYRMWVPGTYAKKYMQEEKGNVICLQLEEAVLTGRTWNVNFSSEAPTYGRLCTVRLTTGWEDFVFANHLQVGDACIFERINEASKTYRVHILRCEEGTSSYIGIDTLESIKK